MAGADEQSPDTAGPSRGVKKGKQDVVFELSSTSSGDAKGDLKKRRRMRYYILRAHRSSWTWPGPAALRSNAPSCTKALAACAHNVFYACRLRLPHGRVACVCTERY